MDRTADGGGGQGSNRAVAELRRFSGLTWAQLADLFGVSRRDICLWASGKPLNAADRRRLMRVLDVVRYADRGAAHRNRAALLDDREGATPLQMLADQRFQDARAALGKGCPRRVVQRTPLSAAAKAARAPLPLEALYDAMGDRVHEEPGRGRAARTVGSQRHEGG